MAKRVLALITLTILAVGTILFYNSSTAVNKFAPVAINNANIFTTTGIQSQKEVADDFIASASPTANQLYPTNDIDVCLLLR